jgi:hypothetical protein
MGVERVDYYSNDEYQQALQSEEEQYRAEKERTEYFKYLAELEDSKCQESTQQ